MRHKLLKATAFILLLFPTLLSAQRGGFTVKVTLTEADTGAGVEFATVSLTAEGSDQAYNCLLYTSVIVKIIIFAVRKNL